MQTMKFMCYIASFLLAIVLFAALTEAAAAEVDSDNEEGLDCICPRHFEPVCAANLVTYPNRCMYDCVRRGEERRGRSLEFLRSGPCGE
nr:uncharacterized protein LOC106626468 [Bactrocera oleae]